MTSVFPIFLILNIADAFALYQSFLENRPTASFSGSLFAAFHEVLVVADLQRAKR